MGNKLLWLVEHEYWIVVPLIAAGSLKTDWMPIALGIAALFWPIRRLATGRWSVRTPVDWPVLLLVFILPFNLWATSALSTTLPQVYRLIAGVALFYTLANWASNRWRLRHGLNLVIALGLALALASPFVVAWNQVKLGFIPAGLYSAFKLSVSDPANPNVMAGSLVLILALLLGMVLFGWASLTKLERLLVGFSGLAMSAALFLSQSRGAWAALVAALGLIFILRLGALRRRRWGWLVAFLILSGVIGLVLLPGFWDGLGFLLSGTAQGNGEPGLLLGDRLEMWSRAVYMLQDFPFTGVGMGAYTQVADRLYPFLRFSPGSASHAHNLFLQIGADLGLPGLTAWLAVLLSICAGAVRLFRSSQASNDSWGAGLGAGLLACQLALVVHGLSDAVTWGMVRPAPLVWYLWGLAAAGLAASAHYAGVTIRSDAPAAETA